MRIKVEDVHVPTCAHEVPGGYPVHAWDSGEWPLVVHIYSPILASPRPRVTSRGTFMPSDYRQHCDKLAASMAYARGLYESGAWGEGGPWDSRTPMVLDLAFWSPRLVGDLDNLAKTVMDAGQLHRGELPGAELWANDRQIVSLTVAWCPTQEHEDGWTQTVVRVRPAPLVAFAGTQRGQEAPKRKKATAGSPKEAKARKGGKAGQQ